MTAPSIATDLLAYNFNLETSEFMSQLRKSCDAAPAGKSFLHELAREGDTLSAEVILQAGGNPDMPDDEGRRPLHEAAFFGHLDMMELLLKNGALLDAPIHPFGYTALYLAVQQRHEHIVRHLLANGARLNVEDSLSGQGLLHVAALNGDMRMAGLLIAAGINVFHEDKRGQTARDMAARQGNRELERILLKVMEHHARFGN